MAARGADATDAQFATIVKYLAKNFGKAGDKPKAAAEKSAGAPETKSESSKATLKFDAKNDWAASGRDEAGQRFSPVKQIDTKNIGKLKLAWQYGIDKSVA